jgi:hypothetical protein
MATWHHQTKRNDSDNGGDEGEEETRGRRRRGGGGDEGEGETRGGGKSNEKKGLRDVVNISWATSTFFLFFFVSFFFFTYSFLGTDLNYSEEERTTRTPTTTTTNILAPSTPNHGCKQLLAGWKREQGDGTREMRTRTGDHNNDVEGGRLTTRPRDHGR